MYKIPWRPSWRDWIEEVTLFSTCLFICECFIYFGGVLPFRASIFSLSNLSSSRRRGSGGETKSCHFFCWWSWRESFKWINFTEIHITKSNQWACLLGYKDKFVAFTYIKIILWREIAFPSKEKCLVVSFWQHEHTPKSVLILPVFTICLVETSLKNQHFEHSKGNTRYLWRNLPVYQNKFGTFSCIPSFSHQFHVDCDTRRNIVL